MNVCLAWLCGLLPALAIDLDGNGLCDVWQARYHAGGVLTTDDDDGDGSRNSEEAAAGTDPFDPASRFHAEIGEAGADAVLTVATRPGKRYTLVHGPGPDGPWTPVGEAQLSLAGEMVMSGPRSGVRRFYRVEATDADSDSDGVSDWAELQLGGYDRLNANSFPAAGTDLAGVTEWLNTLAVGQLTASVVTSSAVEKENTPAVVSYLRGGSQAWPFAVFLKTRLPVVSARSAPGSGEYVFKDAAGAPLVDRLTIPVGAGSAELKIHPVADAVVEVPEHLRITVGGTSLDTTVTITDAANTSANQRLLVAYLRPKPGVSSLGSGLATVRLPGDNDTSTVTVSFSNLNSPVNSTQVQTANSAILQSVPSFNYGGQSWAIRASQFYQTDQAVLDALLGGQIELGVFTEAHVTGEIGGVFQASSGSTEFQPPPAAPPVANLTGAALDRDIARFLTQASFGPTPAAMQELRDRVASHSGDRIAAFSAWIDAELAVPSPSLEAYTIAASEQELEIYNTPGKPYTNTSFDPNHNNRRRGWWLFARHAPDALRQRVTFALSEIFIISDNDTIIRNRAYGAANYHDLLCAGAFGPYRNLLEGISTHPMMGHYLSHVRNQQASFSGGTQITSPDENYAREIMQLFSIGLVQLHPDASLKLGAGGLPIPTYGQSDITELARVFTGWSFSKRHQPVGSTTVIDNADFFTGDGRERLEAQWTNPMKMFQSYHDTGAKSVLGLAVPAGQTGEQDLTDILNHLAAHPNTAPFISRRLIQRLVTANPSAGYLYRASIAFTGSGGNLGSTVRAILLDPEARSPELADEVAGAGKPREPLLRYTAFLRAFDVKSELLLEDLSDYGYPPSELQKFPAGTTRVRVGDTDGTLGQSPLSAPSVFNWFLPDYAPAGTLSANGLVSPELQIANENTVFTNTNYLYGLIYNTTGQAGNPLPNQEEAPYNYSVTADHLKLPFAPLEALYLAVVDLNDDGSFTSADTGAFNNTSAISSACEAVLDHVDLMLCGGALKARYGSTPGQPRMIILQAAASVRSANNNTNNAVIQASVMRDRIEDILWLVSSSPEFVIQK